MPIFLSLNTDTLSPTEIPERLTFAHFEQMEALELRYYGTDFITPAAEAYRWYQKQAYTTTAAVAKGQVVGFVNLFPIAEACFEQLMQGTLNDHFLTAEDVADIAADDAPLHMFLSCILVEPAYRRAGLTLQLLRAAAAPYLPHRHRCKLIATDNITPAGARFSRRLGFERICRSDHGSDIYAQAFSAFLSNIALLSANNL